MARLFAFGCSFTNYDWPTWADIAAREFDHFENWGRSGGGNAFVFCSLMEAIKRSNITQSDTVAVMWTSISREDRWISPDGWLTLGSIYNQSDYDPSFVARFADPTGYLIRDLAMISGAEAALELIGCRYHFFSVVPLEYHDDSHAADDCFAKLDQSVLALYQPVIDKIKPSMFETVFHGDWFSRNGEIKMARLNPHPTPLEHLEYLRAQWPELAISNSTIEWTSKADQLVLLDQSLDTLWTAKQVKRF